MTAALAVAILVAGGIYLLLQRGLIRVILGFVLLGHAANLLLIAAGGMGRRGAPLVGEVDPATAADPLPQAFALTAIVITFGITVYLFGLARAGGDPEPPWAGPESEPGPTSASTEPAPPGQPRQTEAMQQAADAPSGTPGGPS